MTLIGITILAPLFAAMIILLLRKRSVELALSAAAVSLLASLGLLSGADSELILPGLPNMPLRLIADSTTSLLSTMVAFVGASVLVYATGYMAQDKEKNRFFAIMLLFITAMQTLVLAGDWILLLSAWELIGLSSYLLIGFWYQKPGVKAAATRAFLVTRSADLGLYVAVFILIANAGSSEISITLNTEGSTAIVAGIFLLIAAMGKSAQTPFHDWLQRAMAGPTPVSALLHSATLVAAGAILLIRTAPMLPPEALAVIGVVGGITALVAGLIALGETDLKRVLAASTSSQYGLMLLAIGAGVPLAALLHLIAHAAIKSSLFLGAGVFQHTRGSTSLENLKGIGRDRPKIFFGFAIAALALAGIPPLSGFFSKDAIIAATMASSNAWLFVPLVLIGTVLTGAYMARVLHVLWQRTSKESEPDQHQSHQQDAEKTISSAFLQWSALQWMGAGLTALVVLVVVLGATFSAIETSVDRSLPGNIMAEVLGLIAAVTGLLLGWFIPARRLMGPLLERANQGFSIAGGFDNLCVRPAYVIAGFCEKLERRLYSFVLAVGNMTTRIGHIARRSDERGIDRFIFSIVRNTVELGSRARALQSGLIHRELAITVIVTAGIFVVGFIGLFFY
ncbi:MAG: NADH-quinone oxidoreductase subunit L [Gammaproteobacteria bacterium]|nr:NADH-quinone oxidoreductase subunit L [Gammaproteobacteria bacterium]